jgi:hypothetical protein
MEESVMAGVLLSEIQGVIDPVSMLETAAGGLPTAEWTRVIKGRLCDLASRSGCQVCASQCEKAYWPEWLYDVVWLRVREAPLSRLILDSPLVAEIEWSNDRAIQDDFQKLLLARADTRLMIFQAWDSVRGRAIMDKLVEQIDAYTRGEQDDRYIFACYCTHTRRFDYHERGHQ